MTNRDKMLVKEFKEDVTNNYKGESHIEYFYSSKMFGFKEYFRNEEDRVVFFGRDMLITRPTTFANALKRQIPRIKYFGESDNLQIAVGDVIVGYSWIKKYFKEEDHSCHYGLGKTIITDCGIPVVEFPPTNSVAIDLPQAKIISDYNRHDDYVAEISYPDYYRNILNRYRKVTIQTLQFIKGSIHAFYKKSNYTNDHDILNYKNIVKLN